MITDSQNFVNSTLETQVNYTIKESISKLALQTPTAYTGFTPEFIQFVRSGYNVKGYTAQNSFERRVLRRCKTRQKFVDLLEKAPSISQFFLNTVAMIDGTECVPLIVDYPTNNKQNSHRDKTRSNRDLYHIYAPTVDRNGRYLSDMMNAGEVPTSGINALRMQTGGGKTYAHAHRPKTLIVTPLSLIVQQMREDYGVSAFAPSIGINDPVFNDDDREKAADRWCTTHSSALTLLQELEAKHDDMNTWNIFIDEPHGGWIDSYSKLNDLYDYLFENGYKNITIASGTMDIMPSHPLFYGATVSTVKSDCAVNYVELPVCSMDKRMLDCVARLKLEEAKDPTANTLIFFNSKEVAKIESMIEENGLTRKVVILNSETKGDVDISGKGLIVIATAVIREGYSLYGNWHSVYMLYIVQPPIIHQIGQRVREGDFRVYWYKSDDSEKEYKTHLEAMTAVQKARDRFIHDAHDLIPIINRNISHGDYVAANNMSSIKDREFINIRYENDIPTHATVDYCAIDRKAFAISSNCTNDARREWLASYGGVFKVGQLLTNATAHDPKKVEEAKEKKERETVEALEKISIDGRKLTCDEYLKKSYKYTREFGAIWSTQARFVVSIYGVLDDEIGLKKSWQNAVKIVQDCEGKKSKVSRQIRIINEHKKNSQMHQQIVGLSGGSYNGFELSILYLELCQKQFVTAHEKNKLIRQIDLLSRKSDDSKELGLQRGLSCKCINKLKDHVDIKRTRDGNLVNRAAIDNLLDLLEIGEIVEQI